MGFVAIFCWLWSERLVSHETIEDLQMVTQSFFCSTMVLEEISMTNSPVSVIRSRESTRR